MLVVRPDGGYRLSVPVLERPGGRIAGFGIELWLAGVPSMARPAFDQDELARTLGPDRVWRTAALAADRFTARAASR